jgi:ABC-2 type transport system permease protein
MQRYLKLYAHILSFHLKSIMEYRFSFIMKIFYGPAYTLILFLLLSTSYSKTDVLVGWSRNEAFLLFSTFHLMYSICILLFVQSIKYYLWEGFRTGEFDTIMVKPVNVQFLSTVIRPEIQQIPLILCLFIFWIRQLVVLHTHVFSWEFFLYTVSLFFAFTITYLFISTIMTLGFYIVKAAQTYEFFDKVTDYSHYPMSLFPTSLQTVFFTIIPIAFFSYVPTSMLLGKNNATWLGYSAGVTIILFIINQFAWRRALKHYSSASS